MGARAVKYNHYYRERRKGTAQDISVICVRTGGRDEIMRLLAQNRHGLRIGMG
jgi:hypothetical protein